MPGESERAIPSAPSSIPGPGTSSVAPAAPSPGRGRPAGLREAGAVRHDAVAVEIWTVEGIAKVTGEVEVERLEVRGSLSIGGNLAAGSVRVDGALEVLGAASVRGALEVRGPSRFEQGVLAGSLSALGPLRSNGPVRVAGVGRIEGVAHLAKGAEFARMIALGGLEIPGPLTAGAVAIEVRRDSRIASISAGRVAVTRPPGGPLRIPGLTAERPSLEVLRIDAKEVSLEGVTVQVLAADRISLGPDCHVARAIGELVAVDPRAHVGPESRSPPPHGIWR